MRQDKEKYHLGNLKKVMMISDTGLIGFRISSRNENGRSSPIFVLGVLLCTNCSGHGVCKDVKRKDPRENVYFRYAACECEPQYEGKVILICVFDFSPFFPVVFSFCFHLTTI